jgi:hypothetical protein
MVRGCTLLFEHCSRLSSVVRGCYSLIKYYNASCSLDSILGTGMQIGYRHANVFSVMHFGYWHKLHACCVYVVACLLGIYVGIWYAGDSLFSLEIWAQDSRGHRKAGRSHKGGGVVDWSVKDLIDEGNLEKSLRWLTLRRRLFETTMDRRGVVQRLSDGSALFRDVRVHGLSRSSDIPSIGFT